MVLLSWNGTDEKERPVEMTWWKHLHVKAARYLDLTIIRVVRPHATNKERDPRESWFVWMGDTETDMAQIGLGYARRFGQEHGYRFAAFFMRSGSFHGTSCEVLVRVVSLNVKSLPEKFDLEDLSNWFWGQLQNQFDKEEIKEKVVQNYITSIKGHYGYLKETYSRLEEIAQELANGNVGKG